MIRDRFDETRYLPPGYDMWGLVRVYIGELIIAGVLSFACPAQVVGGYVDMFSQNEAGIWVRDAGSQMPPFRDTLRGPALLLFGGILLHCLCCILVLYRAFSDESCSMYLMKRLPTRGELRRRTVVMPLLGCLLTVGICAALYCMYFLFYLVFCALA